MHYIKCGDKQRGRLVVVRMMIRHGVFGTGWFPGFNWV